MDSKKCWVTSIAVFIFVVAFQFLQHQILLKDLYEQHSELWNPQAVMASRMWAIWAAQLALSVLFVTVYAKGYEPHRGTVRQGVRYGVLMGLILALPRELEVFAVFPFPVKLVVCWVVGNFAQAVVAGAIVGGLYKPAVAEPLPQAS